MTSENGTSPTMEGNSPSSLLEEIAFAIEMSTAALANRGTDDNGQEALDLYALALEDIATAAAVNNSLALWELCNNLKEQMQELPCQERRLSDEEVSFLSEGPEYLVAYLADPSDSDACEALIGYLKDSRWPTPLEAEKADALRSLLSRADDTVSLSSDDTPAAAVMPQEEVSSLSQPSTAESPALNDEPPSTEPQRVGVSMLKLLAHELGEINGDLEQLPASAVAPEFSLAQRADALEQYAGELERIGMASEAIGLTNLKIFLTALRRRITATAMSGLTTQQREALTLLPGSIHAYLSAPTDPSTAEGLMDLLRGNKWPLPLEPAYATALSCALSLVVITHDAESSEARQTQAQPEDIVLKVPGDLSRELLEGLLQELPLHTSDFSSAIQHIATGTGTLKDIDVAKRAAHTLKGAANTVGIKGIANLTHHVEDILVALSKHEMLPTRPLADMLTRAGDCLEAMGEAVMGTGPEPDDALAVLQEVLDWANCIDNEGIPGGDEPLAASTTEPIDGSRETAGESAPASAQSPVSNEAMVRVPATLIDELLRLMGETIISTGQVRERSRRLVERNKSVQQQNQVFLQLANELEDLVELRGSAGDMGMARNGDAFDPLEFEHYSELHTISRRLIEAATDSGELTTEVESELSGLNELIEVQNRLHAQSQNAVMRTRMVPVLSVISRLQRSVRQTARLLDKRVALNVSGVDTMIDSNILNELIDPLMHILRNAVDHGIENPEQRRAAGKNAEGKIELVFFREGNQVVVRCRDDGGGLDLTAVRRSAEERGILTPGQTPSGDELARLILAPGFSTRNESTQISGRGIGMDVVHSRVLQLKGGLNLHHSPGQGLEIELRLPATLIATHALIVREHGKIFAISSYGIQDIHYMTVDHIQHLGSESFFRLGETIYPLAHLDNLLHLGVDRRAQEGQEGFPVLLVRLDSGMIHAISVHEIIDSRELVVKGLGRYVPKPQGVVGATILGDGSVAAVIDIPELMRKPVRMASGQDRVDGSANRAESHTQHAHLTALVVDDSLSARRATAQFMKDAGFEVRTAIDGLEAVSILDKWKPDIMLVDMEMPRMNGLELTAHVRAREGTADLPVIMITSRSTEKHRSQAATAGVNVYLTKPFGEEELLQHITELAPA